MHTNSHYSMILFILYFCFLKHNRGIIFNSSIAATQSWKEKENCDDGFPVLPNDGCSAACQIYKGWYCPAGGKCIKAP